MTSVMAGKQIKRDRRPQVRIVCGVIGMLTLATAIVMITTAFRVRDIMTEDIDFDQLRLDISSDSLRAVDILRAEPADTSARCYPEEMPSGGIRLKVDRSVRFGSEFADKNPVHLSTASVVGIAPINSLEDAWFPSRPIVRLESCADYYIDRLTHSLPYLVPEAASLLSEIGSNFRDSLDARGGGDYRIKVTSLLRTESTIRRLRRRNVNSSENSAHLYGTTFDISYSHFICDSDSTPRTAEDLKFLLAEVLIDLHDKGRCWVKHERKQSCFHITVRL